MLSPDLRKLESPMDEPQIRFFVACPRSGSTLLMRIFAESPLCAVTSRLLLMGKADSKEEGFSPDYSILENPHHHSTFMSALKSGKQFLICKEELGNDRRKGECLYNVCPTPAYAMTRPIFLFRDPIRVFDSWKSVGWTDAQSLIDCYINMFQMLSRAPSHAVSCLVYERLIQNPKTEIERICARWGIPFSESMLKFDHPFGSAFVFSTDRERHIYCEKKPLGLFRTVEASSTIEPNVPYHDLLSNAEKSNIEESVGFLYARCCWEDDILRLRAILSERTWIGFDLDDTLHEFRRSSGIAINKVLTEISNRYGTPIPALKDEYLVVLKLKTANAFADGKTKTSFDYRRERFVSLLNHFFLPVDDEFLPKLLDLYELNLMASLELKCGALDLLSLIKKMGKKIIIITEGPQDAQERTIRGLGLDGLIDFLATTAHFGVSKIDGLFPEVLKHLCIAPGDIAYVGDNAERDMKPALAAGIFSIHYAETQHVALNIIPPKINTLKKLQYVLSDDGCSSSSLE